MPYFLISFFICFFNLANAYHGVVMVSRGDVQRISKEKTGKISVGSRIFQGDSIITGANSYTKIVMTDRNIISVISNSHVTIERYENGGKLGGRNADLTLKNGKVRFDVKETYDGEKNKFIIRTPTSITGVRGTDFVVSFDPKTYSTEVVCFMGVVSVAGNKEGQPPGPFVLVKSEQVTKVNVNLIPENPVPLQKESLKKLNQETSEPSMSDKKIDS